MNIYAVNICVDTKTTDVYDKVAINKHPIIIIGDETKLMELLNKDELKDFIKSQISKYLYSTAIYCIRKIQKNDITNLEYKVSDITPIEYI